MDRFIKSLFAIAFISLLLSGCNHSHWNNPLSADNDVQFWSKAVAKKPRDAKSRAFLGMALKNENRLAEAEKQLRISIKLDPRYSDCYYLLGNILNQEGKRTEARQEWKKALATGGPDIKKQAREALRQNPASQ